VEALAAAWQLLPAIPVRVEVHGVEVDAAVVRRLQDEPGGKPGLDFGCVLEAERSERGLCARAVAAGDREVEVAVASRLLADEGSDAPAAVQRGGEAAEGEAIKHLEHLSRPNHRRRSVTLRAGASALGRRAFQSDRQRRRG
jgi:hypothetical protein